MSQTLTPTPFVRDGAGLDITALLATPTSTTLLFANSGREILFILPGAGAETATVDIGTTVLGQAVTNFSAVTMINGHMNAFGPYDSAVDQPGGNTVQVILSTTTSIQVALLQMVGTA